MTATTMNQNNGKAAPSIGHVHLRVADLERSLAFYRDMLGFTVTGYGPAVGLPAVFLAMGDYHHHLGLNTFDSLDGTPPPAGHTGLFHVALVYPGREALGAAVRLLADCNYPIDSAVDHGATISVYLTDPDGNGLELYYDQPRSMWWDEAGRPIMKAEVFDWRELVE